MKRLFLLFHVVTQKQKETTASVSLQEFRQVCKAVDLEIESEFTGIFAQRRTYKKAEAYVAALSDPLVPVKSAWDAAEYAGYENPGPFQSLVGENEWSHGEAWNRTAVAAGKLAEEDAEGDSPGAGIIFDETADLKRGKMTCGVGYQYAGCAGGIVNCATWVIASLAGPRVKTWAAADLFLPEKDWFTGGGRTGTARRKQAGIPDGTEFATKPEIALKQLKRIRGLGVKISWGGGDEVYGKYGKLREDHEEHGESYAYFVPRNFMVETPGGKRRRVDELPGLDEARFETRSAGPGAKGPRYYEFAMIGIRQENHYLLLRRPAREETEEHPESGSGNPGPGDLAAGGQPAGKSRKSVSGDRVKDEGITFCLCYVPPASPIRPTLANLIRMAGRRWGVEETIAAEKGPLGWDENQFRKWESMNHHTALAGIAMLRANLIQDRLDKIAKGASSVPETPAEDSIARPGTRIPDPRKRVREFSDDDLRIPIGDSAVPVHANQDIPRDIGFIRLSLNEVMRLAAIAVSDMSEAVKAFHLRWSKWRRKHQAISRWHHRIARMKTGKDSRAEPAPRELVTYGNQHVEWQANAAAQAA